MRPALNRDQQSLVTKNDAKQRMMTMDKPLIDMIDITRAVSMSHSGNSRPVPARVDAIEAVVLNISGLVLKKPAEFLCTAAAMLHYFGR